MAFDELSRRMEDIIQDKYNYYVGAKSRVDYYKPASKKEIDEYIADASMEADSDIGKLVREISRLEQHLFEIARGHLNQGVDADKLAEARTQMNKAKKDLQNDINAYLGHAEEMKKDHPSEISWAVAIENEIKSKAAVKVSSSTATVREWANANGYVCSDKGRIPKAVQDAYDAAHKPTTIEVTPF